MGTLKNMRTLLNRLIDVPSTDPDDARRRKLVNIVLIGEKGERKNQSTVNSH